jgi:hypothetical protein
MIVADNTGGDHLTGSEDRPTCFVICPIGRSGTAVRLRSDQVVRHIINPVLKKVGFSEALRADHICDPGRITDQAIRHVLGDDLVIADLTGGNPNVFYELAARHSVGKPVIQLTDAGETLPFDLADQRTIFFDITDPDSLEQARQDLENAILPFTTSLGRSMRVSSTLSDYRDNLVFPVGSGSLSDLFALRTILGEVLTRDGQFTDNDLSRLANATTSAAQNDWVKQLIERVGVWLPPGPARH